HAIAAMGLTDLRIGRERAIGAVMWAACDGELRRYAIAELGSGQVVVRSLDDDRELFRVARPETGFWFARPDFSRDGQYLLIHYRVVNADMWIDVWNLQRRERVLHEPARSVAHAFHPDGRRLVLAPLGPELVVWDLVARRVVKRLPLDFRSSFLEFDPEGQRIAVNAVDPPSPVQIRHLDTAPALAWWRDRVGNGPMSWSQDGRLLAIGHSDGRVFVWDVVRGRLASILHGHAHGVITCQF